MEIKKAKEVLANAPEGATHYKETKHSKTYYKVTTDKSDPIFGDVVIAEFWCKYSGLWRPSSFFKKEGSYILDLLLEVTKMNDKQETVLATEMSERDVPSFDEPIIVNPFDACASNEDGEDDVEWKNGDECHYHSTPNVPSKFVAMHPNNPKAAIIWEGGGDCNLACVAIECLRKPESPQEKADREREENGRALFELKVSLTSISCVHWDDQAESSKESWRQFAELVTLKDEHKE